MKKGIYQHYKGSLYRVVQVAQHSETDEALVIYQTLYGDRSWWARPATMFEETVEVNGVSTPRFKYLETQGAVLEVAVLNIKSGQQADFECAFEKAQTIISRMPGYLSHELQRCIERDNRYVLLVHWQSLQHHTDGFRQSPDYQQWKALLHHFYDPFPEVEHYQAVSL